MKKIFFCNQKKDRLCGLFFAGHQPLNLIICHGYQGSKEGGGRALRLAEKAAKQGIHTLCFDFSGTGESAGDFQQTTLTQQKHDLLAAIAYLEKENAYPTILLGRSLGGTTALLAAAENQKIAGLITWAAPFLLDETFSAISVPNCLAKDFLQQDLSGAAKKIPPRPFLIIHGEKDEVVSSKQAALLYQTTDQPKELLLFPTAGHQFSEVEEEIQDCTLSWLKNLTANDRFVTHLKG